MRLKWKKAATAPIDRALATNGAYGVPDRWDLRDEDGGIHATVCRRAGSFVLTTRASGGLGRKFKSAGDAKDAGYRLARLKERA